MTITFTSNYEMGDNKNKIEFTAPVKIGKRDDFTTYEFQEPSAGEHNLIEVKDDYVFIFAKDNTIELSLGEKVDIYYTVQGMEMTFQTQLHFVEIKENNVHFAYTIEQNENPVGNFDITLKLNN